MTTTHRPVYEWSVSDVASWLRENGLSQHEDLLCKVHQLDGASLLSLTESDLRMQPVEMHILGKLMFCYFYVTSLLI